MNFDYIFIAFVIAVIVLGVLVIIALIKNPIRRNATIKLVKPTVTDLDVIGKNKEKYTICGKCGEYNLKSNKQCWKCDSNIWKISDEDFKKVIQADIKDKMKKYKLNLEDIYMVKKRVK